MGQFYIDDPAALEIVAEDRLQPDRPHLRQPANCNGLRVFLGSQQAERVLLCGERTRIRLVADNLFLPACRLR